MEPWERQPKEPPKAWEAFQAYRNLGPGRSITKVAKDLGKHRMTVADWSRNWGWVQRAQAYDAEQDRLFQLEMHVAFRKAAQQNIRVGQGMINAAARTALEWYQGPKTMTPNEAARFADVGNRLQQSALAVNGHSGARRITDREGTSVDVSGLGDEERRLRMLALRRELNVRLGEVDQVDDHGPAPPDRHLTDS